MDNLNVITHLLLCYDQKVTFLKMTIFNYN